MKRGIEPDVRVAGRTAPTDPPAAAGPQPHLAGAAGLATDNLAPRVRQALESFAAEIERLRAALVQAERRVGELQRLADQDALVPVVNRRAFVRELERVLSYAKRYKVPCSVIYFDLNHLKAINDRYGHAGGDVAIAHVARVLAAKLRDSDMVGRLGGDEFGVVLAHAAGEAALAKAASLAGAVAATPCRYGEETIAVSVAYGCYAPGADDDADKALDAADRAMYEQKKRNLKL